MRTSAVTQAPCALLAALALACAGDPDGPAPPETAPAAPRRPVRDVLDAKLTEFGVTARGDDAVARELRADVGLLPGEAPAVETDEPTPPAGRQLDPQLDPELVELRDGLVGMVARDGRQLAMARKDVENLAGEIVPVLVDGLLDGTRSSEEFRILSTLATAAPHADIAVALLDVASDHDDPFVRRQAAWTISQVGSAPGADAVVPGLVRRLKYERDPETFIWLALALAAFENYAGLPALYELTYGPEDDAIARQARLQVPGIVERSGAADAVALRTAWDAGEIGRTEGASDGARAELWLLVADLSGEHFQLRGVDDARYTLSRLGPWAAVELAEALEDDDDYVRLHVAQSLERMGPRGRAASDALVAALSDPSDAVAGAAAETLVAVAGDDAIAALVAQLDADPSHELKVALVRSLGRAPAAPVERLVQEFETAAAITDLRLAAAEGLVHHGRADDVLPWLAETMAKQFGDPAGAEALVETWLEAAPEDDEARAALRDAWFALAPPAAVIHTGEQARERRSRRATLVREFLAD